MHYYEVWYYFYDSYAPVIQETIVDSRTDYNKEFTFYIKNEKPINSVDEMITHCEKAFPVTEKYNVDTINCIDPKHYPHMSRIIEIHANEFTMSSGVPA